MKIRIRSSFGNEISSSPKVRTWRQPLLSLSLSLTPGLPPSSLCTVSPTVSDSPRSWRTEATGHFRCARERNFRPSVSWTWPSMCARRHTGPAACAAALTPSWREHHLPSVTRSKETSHFCGSNSRPPPTSRPRPSAKYASPNRGPTWSLIRVYCRIKSDGHERQGEMNELIQGRQAILRREYDAGPCTISLGRIESSRAAECPRPTVRLQAR